MAKKINYGADEKWQIFIEAFLKNPKDIKAAAEEAGIKPDEVYRLRSKNEDFNKWLAVEARSEVFKLSAEMDAIFTESVRSGKGLSTAMHRTLKLGYELIKAIETKTNISVTIHTGEPIGDDSVMDSLLEDLKKRGIVSPGMFN